MLNAKITILKQFIKTHAHFALEEDGKRIFIKINPQCNKEEITQLLDILWNNKFELSFLDLIYPTISDPGAYFSYSTRKTTQQDHWSMTYGNHGWSGGIYHIKKETVSQQVYNLIRKKELENILIIGTVFLSHYKINSIEKSFEKDREIFSMHK